MADDLNQWMLAPINLQARWLDPACIDLGVIHKIERERMAQLLATQEARRG